MGKKISLKVHQNKVARQKAKELKNNFLNDAKALAATNDLRGFTIVCWDKNGTPHVAWQTVENNPIPGDLLPSYIHNAILRRLAGKDAQHLLNKE